MALNGRVPMVIMTRGRWGCTKCVLCYKKHGHYLRMKDKLEGGELQRVAHSLVFLKRNLLRLVMSTRVASKGESASRQRGRK